MKMTVVSDNGETPVPFQHPELRLLEKAIRRIVRSHDLLSKALVRASGLTAAQLVLLKGIETLGEVTTTALSAYADISSDTVVTILDNIEDRNLIESYRSVSDRRIVHTRLTEAGRAVIRTAPEPLGDTIAQRFASLGEHRRAALVQAANEIADLMERGPGTPPTSHV